MKANMTEEDTFMKLKKISSFELELVINELSEDEFSKIATDEFYKEKFLKKYGWTLADLIKYSKEKYSN